ncbi:MAG: tRNA dihydrouridine synthase DusB [Verrucomicrobiota bacterium]
MKSLKLGSLQLASPLTLSPLAGYTNLPMRMVIREIGGVGLCTTDLVNARSLIEKNPKAIKLVESHPLDKPFAVQLFGSVASEMVEASKIVADLGADSIDINMGCPVRKVVKIGGGSAMMTQCAQTAALVRQMVNAVKIPITCKMRLGWDDNNITAPELAVALEEAGAQAITVHGRTREQGFEGSVHLRGIQKVVEAVKTIPVIGNGDVTTPQAAEVMWKETGCTGIGIGRGAFYNPWIFKQILEYTETGICPAEPSFNERIRIVTRHLDWMVQVFGESHGCRLFRKVGPWYSKRFGPASFFNKKIVLLNNRTQFDEILSGYIEWRSRFLDESGELQPRYRPGAMELNFRECLPEETEPAVTQRTAIPVPKGPQELW